MGTKSNAIASERDWQTESDVRTLTEAEKIKADKARHTKAKDHAKKMLGQMQNVANGGSDAGAKK